MEVKGDLTSSTIDEQSIIQEIKELEEGMVLRQPYPIKKSSREIENIITRILKDYSNILEESIESRKPLFLEQNFVG